jgi:subtilisin family serine protease
VLDAAGFGTTSTIIKALTWLLDTSINGTSPNPGNATNAQYLNINVINMSFGFIVTSITQGNYQTLCSLLSTLVNGAGMVAVAAASECDADCSTCRATAVKP